MMKKGFTLMELVVVMLVIIVLAGVIAPQVNRVINKAREARAKADLEKLKSAMLAYKEDTGRLPPGSDFCGDLTSGCSVEDSLLSDDGSAGWDGPYLDSPIPQDPWSRYYRYDNNDGVPSGEISYALSRGRNGVIETTNPNRTGATAGGDDIYVVIFNDGRL